MGVLSSVGVLFSLYAHVVSEVLVAGGVVSLCVAGAVSDAEPF